MNIEELKEALSVLEISEGASINDIKEKYKSLMMEWHPDRCKDDLERCKEMTQRIGDSYKIVLSYCMNYKFSFKEDVLVSKIINEKEEFWKEHFGDDPLMC